jgi:hypothetical protein
MCDKYLGKVLDTMDKFDLWKDTMLIVNTDHGYLLGEHGWWAKCVMPFYNEVAHIPLFIWDPRTGKVGERRTSLVQTIDLAPTLLDFFNLPSTPDMRGMILSDTLKQDTPVREAVLFGMHGGHINCTDGRYVYMLGPEKPGEHGVYNYTVMPTHMRALFSVEELRMAELHEPFGFTKGVPLLKIPSKEGSLGGPGGETIKAPLDTLLYDLELDPGQERPFKDSIIEHRMQGHIVGLLKNHEAPEELYLRFGLNT